jgi:hypothetical protein
VALGRLQEAIGLAAGITVGFAMVVPAALLALVVPGRQPAAATATNNACQGGKEVCARSPLQARHA